ncbi:MAG TPA: KamA family radical SAM protein, partial [Syntrophales bacterium]|nr:KamA family radical SAM protein [Syntrophales bacterium]
QVRAQVIPSAAYCRSVAESRAKGFDMDFMGEKSTSPIDGITRRYPEIVILKPFNACPQICVYCQRNWEIKSIDDEVQMSREKVREAIAWIADHESITEVLVTGGDPLTLKNDYLDNLLGEIAAIKHVDRIRIGTRVPVTLPFRINDGFLAVLAKYHEWGKREIAIVTHFEHPTEMTEEALEVIKKLKNAGINIYNQQVFTYFNSRKFETCLLRRVLKLCGVDPYYSFSTKGKEETVDFRVPIARIEQERTEEARLLPGLIRTDEPVFNLPRLGKSQLKAWQDHEVIMILPDGRRVYRFYSWEVRLVTARDYLYTDIPIYDYLKRLDADGENVADYSTIWYYF